MSGGDWNGKTIVSNLRFNDANKEDFIFNGHRITLLADSGVSVTASQVTIEGVYFAVIWGNTL